MHILKPGILFSLFFSTFLNTGIANNKISIDNISSQVGHKVTVCSKVYITHVTKGDKPVTYLNLGAPYPDQKLSLVIFQKDRINFSFPPENYYNLQDVCVSGEVNTYRSKHQIIISLPSQIEIKK